MSNIPKKVIERFIKSTPRFQKVLQIAKDRDVNESDTVSILKDMLGEVFGYDKYLEVTSEFSIRSTYCDLAIKVDDKVQFLIEAKSIGIELKDIHMKQACDYGANHGVPWVILTNGITWKIYKIRFEQPINFDMVYTFDFLTLNIKNEKCQECLFILAKEGLAKDAREEFYEKVQSVNRYVIGNLLLCEPILGPLRRELKRLAEGMKIEIDEIENILRNEVLKREIVEGDEAETARKRVFKFYKKASSSHKVNKEVVQQPVSSPEIENESVTERLLREAQELEE